MMTFLLQIYEYCYQLYMGIYALKVLPLPNSLVTSSFPSCLFKICLTIDKPNPEL